MVRTRISLGAAAAVAAVVALNGAGVLGGEASKSPDARARNPLAGAHGDRPAGLVGPGEPCLDAVPLPTDLALIRASVEIPVWAPAADATITRAWACGGETPVLMFGRIQVSFEAGWSDVDIAKKWADLIADYGGRTETIQGYSALVQAAPTKEANQQVMIVSGGTLVRLLATSDVPISDLVDLADDIRLPPPAG